MRRLLARSVALCLIVLLASVSSLAQQIVLRVATWDGEDGQRPIRAAIAHFEKQHPNVKVEVEQLTDYKSRLMVQLASGTAPHVYMVGDGDYAAFARGGLMADLTPYLQRDGVDLGMFVPKILDNHRQPDGRYYSLSKDFSTMGLYYNEDYFDEAGLLYPEKGWTWDEALSMSKKLMQMKGDGTVTRWGLVMAPFWDAIAWSFAWSNGGRIMDENFERFSGFLDGDATVDAINWYYDLFNVQRAATPDNVLWPVLGGEMKAFGSGQAAMMMWGNWAIIHFRDDPSLNWGTVVPPVFRRSPTTFIMEAGWGLNPDLRDPEVRELSWKLLIHLAGPEGQRHMGATGWAMPSIPAVADEVGIATDPYFAAFFDAANYSMPTYWTKTPRFWDILGAYWPARTAAYNGEKALKVALTEAAEVMDADLARILAEYRKP